MALEGFELFTGGRGLRTSARGPQVSINRNGTITINKPALELWGEQAPELIQFQFNPKSKMVALVPADEGDPSTYRISVNGKSGAHSVRAKTLAESVGIDLSTPQKQVPTFDKDSSALVFEVVTA